MRVAYYGSKRETDPTVADVSWDDLAVALGDTDDVTCEFATCPGSSCPQKDGPAWSPVDIQGSRSNGNVKAVTAAVFDLDHLTDAQVNDVARKLSGYRYVCHSTHCHAPPDDNRLRAVLPLSRPVKPAEWAAFHPAAVAFLGIPADPACRDVSRFYYLPRPRAGVPFIYERGEGSPLDVEEVLRQVEATRPPPPPLTPEEVQTPMDVGQAREAIQAFAKRPRGRPTGDLARRERDRENREIVLRALSGRPLAEQGARDDSLNRAMTSAAWALTPGTPFAVVAAVFHASIAGMASLQPGDDLKYWLAEAEDMYNRACQRRVDVEAKDAAARAATVGAFEKFLATRREATATITATATTTAGGDDWQTMLERDKAGNLVSCGYNARLILSHATEVGEIRWNTLAKCIDVRGGLFASSDAEVLPVDVTDWLFKAWGILMPTSMVTERLIVVAREHSYNPVADYLRGLTWDGTERLDDWMMRFLRASVINDATGESVSNWMRLVGRRWLISMAARALSPGCQVDTVPILEGSQGCGKTSTLRILGGRWHTDTKITLGDKDSYMVAGSNWVVELAEIGALKRGDMETIKAFLTAREDSYRMPYGRAVGKHPRMSVIIGTTNDVDNYLLDPTGNRRYWPIKIGLVDRDGLEAARDQLFAEAVAAYDAGERWHMDSVEATAFESAVTSSRVASDDPYVEIIREWWPRSGIKLGFVTTLEVALRCLGIPRDRVTRQDSMRIGAALRAGGWKRRRHRVGNELVWGYAPPQMDEISEARARQEGTK